MVDLAAFAVLVLPAQSTVSSLTLRDLAILSRFLCANDAIPVVGRAGGAAIMTKLPKTQKDTEERQSETDRELDEALEETFPASDPVAVTRPSAGASDRPAAKPSRPKSSPKK